MGQREILINLLIPKTLGKRVSIPGRPKFIKLANIMKRRHGGMAYSMTEMFSKQTIIYGAEEHQQKPHAYYNQLVKNHKLFEQSSVILNSA